MGHTGAVPMRADCKFYETRTYRTGETVRKCDLDLAPEAPWRCPADCPAFERRLADVNWAHGSLVAPATPPEPASLSTDPDAVAALLDEAENIVNAAGPRIRAELDQGGRRSRFGRGGRTGGIGKFFRRRGRD